MPQTLDFADQAIKLFAAVPATFWAALVGACVALTGVMLTNWGTSRRLAQQLTHDAQQKQLDRLAALRKDIYLRAGEQLVRTQQHLSSLNMKDAEEVNLADGLTDFIALAAQVGLIGTQRTVGLVAELSIGFGEGFLELLPDAAPAHRARTTIKLTSEEIAAAQARADAAIEGMRQINQSGQRNDQRFEALQRAAEYENDRIDRVHKEREAAFERLHAANRVFHDAAAAVLDRLSDSVIDAQIALREEMGLATDPVEARRLSAEARERMGRASAAANRKVFAAREVAPEPVKPHEPA